MLPDPPPHSSTTHATGALVRFAAGVVAVLALVYLGLVLFDEAAATLPATDPNIARLRAAERYGPVDVLFVGSSYTYSAIDDATLRDAQIDAFNLGEPTAGAEMIPLLYADYVDAVGQRPRVVVVDVSVLTVSDRADNFVLYPIHRHLASPCGTRRLPGSSADCRTCPRCWSMGPDKGSDAVSVG